MRILAIVYCFPPLLVPAALCYLKLVLGLRENGVEVEIVEIDPRSFLAPDPGLLDPRASGMVPADLVRHTVWSPEANRIVRLGKRLLRSTSLGMRVFEPKKREWTFAALRRLRRCDLARYDAIVTCSQPHANHLLGLRLQARARRPWIAYFSDPWARNPYARYAHRRVADYHRALEAEVLRAADRVLFTSDEMLRLAREEHADALEEKAGVLPHSFVPEWFGAAREETRVEGPIRVLHTGHFYGPRSPAPLVNALTRLQRERDLRGRLRIESYGNFPAADRARLPEILRIHPTVPYLESLALMRQHDLLLLVDAPLTAGGESVFLPSKLVDYLGAGRPILAVTPERGATARVVREVGGIVCDVAREEEIAGALARILDRGLPPAPDPAAVLAYEYRRVAARLVSTLEEIASRR